MDNPLWQKKYLKYKNKYLKKAGKCTPFSKSDCIYSEEYGRCKGIKSTIFQNQNKCICNYKTRRCVKINKERGENTLNELKELIQK